MSYIPDTFVSFVVIELVMSPLAPGQQIRGSSLRLVREVVLAEGPLFTSEDAVDVAGRIGMSRDAAYKALSLAARAGIVSRLKGGLYRAEPPFGPEKVHEFVVATTLVRPSVISGPSALSHWSLIDQMPLHVVTASTPKSVLPPMSRGSSETGQAQSGRHGWVIEGITYVYRRIPEAEMFGISDVWLDTETQVPMFDRERAVLATFLHPRSEGPARFGELLIEEHHDDLDLEKLMRYADRSGKPRVVARISQAAH
jgi:predicted transcriptional regulator of viral defense system